MTYNLVILDGRKDYLADRQEINPDLRATGVVPDEAVTCQIVVPSTGRSLRTCFLCFFLCFFWTENLVFSRARSLSKQSVFRKCFFAENLGEGGGGKNFGMRSYSEVA